MPFPVIIVGDNDAYFLLDAGRYPIGGEDALTVWRDRFLRLERYLEPGGTARIEELGVDVNRADCTVMAQRLELARRYCEIQSQAEAKAAVDAAETILGG